MLKRKAILYGFVAGSAIASVITLFTTPLSSKDLKQKIKEKQHVTRDNFLTLKQEGVSLVNQVKETSKESSVILKSVASDLKSSIDKWQNETAAHQTNIKHELEDIEQTIKNLEDRL